MQVPITRINLTPDYSISRIIKGGWHLAGGHGSIDHRQAIEDMRSFVEHGITTFDCADIYTGVEELIGRFIVKIGPSIRSGNLPEVQIHTKYVPDYNMLAILRPSDTTRIIDRSLQRLGVDCIDMVQFAWWDFNIPGHVEAADQLVQLQKTGKIRHIGVTNYDSVHLQELLDAGIHPISNQIQYSILDRRPAHSMIPLCREHGISLLCYGALGGGFYAQKYLGSSAPSPPFENRSLTKYHLIIEDFGGWDVFQDVLTVLEEIAEGHSATVSEVAMRYLLQKDSVAAVIVGARHNRHMASLQRVNGFVLSSAEMHRINSLARPNAFQNAPVYLHERTKSGKHGRIMKYNLNEQRN